MIRINQLALEVGHGPGAIKKKAARLLKVPETSIRRVDVVRRSIDARKKDRILYSYIVDVKLAEKKKEETAVKKADSRNIQIETEARYRYPAHGKEVLKDRPVIIGAGPAGLFAALALAENGFAPLLLEQGDPVEVRAEKVEAFWRNGDDSLDLHSNVQFGEGGAGTFSDGKLNTLVKDVSGRNGKVLETFVEAGADGSILYDSRPHIGTDVLREVVKNIRKRIQDAGGEVRFGCRVEQVLMEDGRTGGVLLAGGERIQSRTVVLAVGHSARALFSSLWEQKVLMEPKAFAVGLRVQHPQKMINLSQYGREDAGELGAAPYKVTASTKSGRGVYSFCMCPGGYVVNASSEEGYLAVNGMSYHARDSHNANSAIVVTVTPEDFESDHPLAGIAFQRKLEKAAYKAGKGKIPVQRYGDFYRSVTGKEKGKTEAEVWYQGHEPCMKGAYEETDLAGIFPAKISSALVDGMEDFNKKIRGFSHPLSILSGVESRTSSPVRIVRDNHSLESVIGGLYPCGEGAGYAGGITSAAADGIKIAEKIRQKYAPFL